MMDIGISLGLGDIHVYILSNRYQKILRVEYSVATSPKNECHAVSNE